MIDKMWQRCTGEGELQHSEDTNLVDWMDGASSGSCGVEYEEHNLGKRC